MGQIFDRITGGKGVDDDIKLLEEMCQMLVDGSLCALGQGAANPVLTTLKYFRGEYEAHIKEKRCPAKVCKGLITYSIDEKKCPNCGLCIKNCPVGAITPQGKKQPVLLNKELCIRCGACLDVCRLGAVKVE
jgi:ferredoxin